MFKKKSVLKIMFSNMFYLPTSHNLFLATALVRNRQNSVPVTAPQKHLKNI